MTEALLVLRGAEKSFPGTRALDGVDFELRAGEVHALVGENGAGKSTLVKVLTAVHTLDAGAFEYLGKAASFDGPHDAIRQGIASIHQELRLLPELSITENLFLERPQTRPLLGFGPRVLDWPRMHAEARRVLRDFGLDVDVRRTLSTLGIAARQLVAIARAVQASARVLVLDEPGSSLDREEIRLLTAQMQRLRERGLGLVYVSHFLERVLSVSDRVTVLRDGRLVATRDVDGLERSELVRLMLGEDVARREAERVAEQHPSSRAKGSETAGTLVFEVAASEQRAVESAAKIELRAGEVLGVAGLLGSGRSEMLRGLFALDGPLTARIEGQSRSLGGPATALRHGIAFCSEDRRKEGIFPSLSVRENLEVIARGQAPEELARRIGLRFASLDQEARTLSGGNQQKLVLARLLAASPRVLLLDEPTRGIDIGARQEIEDFIDRAADEGMAIVLVSSEPLELARRARRVLVLERGRLKEVLESPSEAQLLRSISGAGSAVS